MRYNKRIIAKRNRLDQLILESDRGEVYETNLVANTPTPLSDWWSKQNQSELRHWQKDAFIGEFWRQHGELDLYVLYKKGQGYSQPHDLTLAYSPTKKVWMLSTEQHTWLMPDTGDDVIFNIDLAFGPINTKESRFEIYTIIDNI